MIRRAMNLIDPFILALLGCIVLASILPPRGMGVPIMDGLADAGIVLLFFLHGAKLSRRAILDGVLNLPLHLAVLTSTFVLFPALGLAIASLPMVTPAVAAGMLFLTLLPSTVQSSIAFTAIARGNVPGAICAASLSNCVGIVLTPLLVALLMRVDGTASVSMDAVRTIALNLLLPFAVGHLMQPLIGGFVGRHKLLVARVDRGSILLIVYTAFGGAVVEGLWNRVSPAELSEILILSAALLTIVMSATWGFGKIGGMARADAVVLLFCGSKKSLASGVPIAAALFAPGQLGLMILPLMLFHQLQLIVCAILARRLANMPQPELQT